MYEKPFKIFVVEDDEWYSKLLVHNLSLNPDYEIESFTNGKDCLANLHKNPEVITLDYRLPDMKGLEILKNIKAENQEIQVILISEQDEIEVVVELLKYGAYDYIVKSNDIRERLLNTVQNIRNGVSLKREIVSLRSEVKKKYSYQNTIVGNNPATQKIFGLIEKATRTNISVTITGETGTGKELVAKAIHYNSARAAKPFIAVNMAAIPKDLTESELFGHEKGAFTGATFRRIGKFEEANGGTLFLDEIAEMDISCITGERICSDWQQQTRQNRLPHHRGHQPKLSGSRCKRHFQTRSLLPAFWIAHRTAATARTGQRHCYSFKTFYQRILQRKQPCFKNAVCHSG